jgi:signal peptidase
MNYIGTSMNPTLKSGDWLRITTNHGQRIRQGDVIVFIPPGGDSRIIHRVISVDSKGIKTRGDNCNHIDPWILNPDQVLGRVVYAERGSRLRRVVGGPRGFIWTTALKAIRSVGSSLSYFLRPAYHWLTKNGVLREWRSAQIKTRVISLERFGGTELQLLMGRRVIGRWLPGKSGWNIRRPFRLFVDEEALPENPGKASVVSGPLSVVDEGI